MKPKSELLLGSTVVSWEGRKFILRDAENAKSMLFVEDADVADLILFLYGESRRAREAVRVQRRPVERKR